jgi:hypothetical protein
VRVADGDAVDVAAAGSVMVDMARLSFADADALGEWEHDRAIDGRADFVFWGRDAERVADALDVAATEDGVFGWVDLPIDDSIDAGRRVEEYRGKHGLRFATDFRPHSHHYEMMKQVRASRTESGMLDIGGATMCGFMTSWGDGVFPVQLHRDRDGGLLCIRVLLGTDQAIANMRAVNE